MCIQRCSGPGQKCADKPTYTPERRQCSGFRPAIPGNINMHWASSQSDRPGGEAVTLDSSKNTHALRRFTLGRSDCDSTPHTKTELKLQAARRSIWNSKTACIDLDQVPSNSGNVQSNPGVAVNSAKRPSPRPGRMSDLGQRATFSRCRMNVCSQVFFGPSTSRTGLSMCRLLVR